MYLGEEYTPELPGTQVFVAPGPEHEPLSDGPSPWIHGRTVSIPARYWHYLLLRVQESGPAAAASLDAWSGSADPDSGSLYQPSADEVDEVCRATGKLADTLRAGAPRPSDQPEPLGSYPAADCAGMLDAVCLVLRTAVEIRVPFAAWYE